MRTAPMSDAFDHALGTVEGPVGTRLIARHNRRVSARGFRSHPRRSKRAGQRRRMARRTRRTHRRSFHDTRSGGIQHKKRVMGRRHPRTLHMRPMRAIMGSRVLGVYAMLSRDFSASRRHANPSIDTVTDPSTSSIIPFK